MLLQSYTQFIPLRTFRALNQTVYQDPFERFRIFELDTKRLLTT